ncbi:MAG TPA: hypothetical protein VE871_17980 [Longimicrobium sp.]|nr:hypothetical protein [Longimicrobium sp.]
MTIAAAAVLAACTANPAPQDAPSAPPGPTPATTPPVAGSPGGTMAPPRRPPEMPAPDARLVRLRAEPLNGRGYAQLGLSGANKPNGLEYRLRQEVPSERPAYLKAELDGLQLFIADSTADGWMGFYRGPLGGGPNSGNVAYRAVMYRRNGSRAWDTNLNLFLSRTDHLEVQDVRYANGRLYFNEACQSYSREAGGACSSLLAVDPVAGTVAWRTPPRTSNNIILLHGPYVVAGYGFTAEPDSLFLVDRATGRILDRQPLDSAAGYLEVTGEELVVVTTNQLYYFRIQPR